MPLYISPFTQKSTPFRVSLPPGGIFSNRTWSVLVRIEATVEEILTSYLSDPSDSHVEDCIGLLPLGVGLGLG